MKLVDILARELKTWPDNNLVDLSACFVAQDSDGMLVTLDPEEKPNADQFYQGIWARSHWTGGDLLLEVAEDYASAIVTRAEWQAAVDALNADKCDHSHGNKIGCPECGELNAPKVVEWDGVGSPQPGCSIEYSIGDGWYPCEVRYVLNRDDCPGIALIAWCEHLGKDQYLSNDRDHRFRPARTAEQVAAEEREKGIQEICATLGWLNIRSDGSAQEAAILYDAGYRKEPKPCGS